jgi:hypothetical protein
VKVVQEEEEEAPSRGDRSLDAPSRAGRNAEEGWPPGGAYDPLADASRRMQDGPSWPHSLQT